MQRSGWTSVCGVRVAVGDSSVAEGRRWRYNRHIPDWVDVLFYVHVVRREVGINESLDTVLCLLTLVIKSR